MSKSTIARRRWPLFPGLTALYRPSLYTISYRGQYDTRVWHQLRLQLPFRFIIGAQFPMSLTAAPDPGYWIHLLIARSPDSPLTGWNLRVLWFAVGRWNRPER